MQAYNSLTRRRLLTVLPAGAGCLGCLGARVCAAQNAAAPTLKSGEKADVTWQDLFDFAYERSIPVMMNLAGQIGRKRFIEMVQKATDAAAIEAMGKMPAGKRDLAAWTAPFRKSALYDHVLALQTVKDTPTEFAMNVSQCLWAKTFRGKGAADLGYALICREDLVAAPAFNPKLKLIRTKTLMQGDDRCDLRYVFGSGA